MTSSQRKSFNTAGKKVLAGISKDAKFESDLLKTNEDIGPQSLYGGREVRPPTPSPPYKRLWNFATLRNRYFFALLGRTTFSAMPMNIRGVLFIKSWKKPLKGQGNFALLYE